MEHVSGNIFIRPVTFAGGICAGHKHNFSHTTFFASSMPSAGIHVRAKLPDGRVVEFDKESPGHLLIHKDVEHEFTRLDPDPKIVMEALSAMPREALIAELLRYRTAPTQAFCIYAHRTPQSPDARIQTGWEPARALLRAQPEADVCQDYHDSHPAAYG